MGRVLDKIIMIQKTTNKFFLSIALLFLSTGLSANAYRLDSRMPAAFDQWHWPVPAGEWQIARGPCGETGQTHNCNYYEERCSYDIAPKTGSSKVIPILAPYGGRIIFSGQRASASYPGSALVIEHPDGRMSVLYQITKVVVGIDQHVDQGEVVGYIDTSKRADATLHFFVQPNPVARNCIIIENLDAIKAEKNVLVSYNKDWSQIIFTNPPQELLDTLPPIEASNVGEILDTHIRLTPNQRANLWVLLTGILSDSSSLRGPTGQLSTLIRRTQEGALFKVSLESFSSVAGYYKRLTFPDSPHANLNSFRLQYEVTESVNLTSANSVLMVAPEIIRPSSYSFWKTTPLLCWSMPENVGKEPIEFRVKIVGPSNVDSDWISDTCWLPPDLPAGSYVWKVLERDARGYMNRPNQYPFAFIITGQ